MAAKQPHDAWNLYGIVYLWPLLLTWVNFNPKLGKRLNFGIDKQFHPTLYWACDYFSMLVFKLIHVSESGPW